MKSVIICKDYRVFMEIICRVYGFDPKRVQFASEEIVLHGLHPETPIFKYYSAGFPHWLTPTVMDRIDARFKNKFSLPEINSQDRYQFSVDMRKKHKVK